MGSVYTEGDIVKVPGASYGCVVRESSIHNVSI